MFPIVRHRVVIVAAIVISGASWLLVEPLLEPVDGSGGLSLMSARVGLVPAVLTVAGLGLVGLAVGLIASAMGNPLGGVFGVSGGLCVLAARGGAIEGWMHRSQLPHDYMFLMVEVLIWQVGVVVMLGAIWWLRSPVRAAWPALAYDDHLGVDLHLRWPQTQSLVAGAVCSVCGFVAGCLLIRNGDVGQVIGSMFLSFGLGGFVAGLIFPRANPSGILFSPAVVATVAYAYGWMAFDSGQDVFAAWHGQTLPGVLLALPIHYMSAGVGGCAAGIGLAQVIEASKVPVVDA